MHPDIGNTKKYYDIYLKKIGEGKCKICGKDTTYISLGAGYYTYCSKMCFNKNVLKGKTYDDLYGKEKSLELRKARKYQQEKKYNYHLPEEEILEKCNNYSKEFITEIKKGDKCKWCGKQAKYILGTMSLCCKKRFQDCPRWKRSHINRMKTDNPIHREDLKDRLMNHFLNNVYSGPTKPQIALFDVVKLYYSDSVLDRQLGLYMLDVAVDDIKLDIEYDCSYWHTRTTDQIEKDKRRNSFLLSNGWRVMRYIDYVPTGTEFYWDLQSMVKNNSYLLIKGGDARDVNLTSR